MAFDMNDPKTFALMQLASGLMAGGAPSYGPPKNFLGVLGGAGPGALHSFMVARHQKDQESLNDLKRKVLDRDLNAPPGLMNVPAQGVVFDPVTRQPVYSNVTPTEPKPPAAPHTRKVRIGDEEVTQEWDGTAWKEVGRGKAFSGTPLVSMTGEQQETAFQKRVGQEMGDQYANILKADINVPSTIAKYERLGGLLGQVETGKFKGTTTSIKSAAKGLGIDLAAMGVTDDVAPAQAAIALSNQIALELRNPAGGAGMPGALSDKDREFLLQSIPSLENDPAAIGKMIEYRVKLAKREQEVARKAREYRKKHGKFDEGFYDELQEWSNKNPVFPDVTKPSAPAKTVTRTGTLNGKKVIEYSDGSVEYAK